MQSRFSPPTIFSFPISRLWILSILATAASPVFASTWGGGNGNWDSTGSPGWISGGVPNAAGAIADFAATSATTTQNFSGGVTVGVISFSGNSTTIHTVTNSNGITFDNNGSESLIETTGTGTSTSRLSFGGTSAIGLTLAGNLRISNTGTSTNSSGSISFSTGTGAAFHGNGNITFSNVSNSTSAGHISLGSSSDFTGNVLIEKGAVVFTTSSSLGASGNAVTLGSSGQGSATLVTSASITVANAVTVAANSAGTLLLGSTSTSTGSNFTTFSGNLTLNGSVSLLSTKGAGADVRYTGVISGVGNVTTVGVGETQFGNGTTSVTNTYTGNTTLTETSSLTLADNAKMTFVIGANGVNNKISATGGNNNILTLDGDFIFDLTGAASTGSWTIVDISTLAETFSSTFTVQNFTEVSDVWTRTVGETTYTFSEATGVLTAVPEPATYVLMALAGAVLFFVRRRSISA